MFIKKIKIVDNNNDPLKEKIGKKLIITNNKIIEETTGDTPRRIRYKGGGFENTSDGLYQYVQQVEYFGPSSEIPRTTFADHTAEFIAPVHRNEIAVNNDSKAISSGYVKAKFNFVS